jgi:hypothetical protein
MDANTTDPWAALFQISAAFMATAIPGWKLPDELPDMPPPTGVPFENIHDMHDELLEGDHIAVLDGRGSWHHGIYVGRLTPARSPFLVLEVWDSKITARRLGTFVAGGTRFAYMRHAGEDAALQGQWSVVLALHLMEKGGSLTFARADDDVRFATLCRTLRCCEQARARAVQCLQELPAPGPPKQYVRGFK